MNSNAEKKNFVMGDRVKVLSPEKLVVGIELMENQPDLLVVKARQGNGMERKFILSTDEIGSSKNRIEVKDGDKWVEPSSIEGLLGKTVRFKATYDYFYRYHKTRSNKSLAELQGNLLSKRVIVDTSLLEKVDGCNLALKAVLEQEQPTYVSKRAEWDKELKSGETAKFRKTIILCAFLRADPNKEIKMNERDNGTVRVIVMNPITRVTHNMCLPPDHIMVHTKDGLDIKLSELSREENRGKVPFSFEWSMRFYAIDAEKAYMYLPETTVEILESDKTRAKIKTSLFGEYPKYISKSFLKKVQ